MCVINLLNTIILMRCYLSFISDYGIKKNYIVTDNVRMPWFLTVHMELRARSGKNNWNLLFEETDN